MKRKGSALLIAALFIFVISACVTGGNKKTSSSNKNRGNATGYATIYDNDLALATDRAIDDAKSKLVKKILGETIEGRSVMKNFELVSQIVEAKSIGLVKNQEIIKRWSEGNLRYVTLEGTVLPSAVGDVIKKILDDYGRPKFMVLIREKFDSKRRPNQPGFTETEMIIQEIMGKAGFEFVDAAMTQQLMRKEKAKMQSAVYGNVRDDVRTLLLNDAGAEVIIIGTTETRDQTATLRANGIESMMSKQAIVRIKAIDVYTGRTLASISRNAPGIHIQSETASKKAIERAMKKILGQKDSSGKFKQGPFIKTIIRKFVQAAGQRQISIIVTGLNFKDLKKFRNNIAQRIRGVKKVIPKGQTGKAARLMVYFAGKTTELGEELQSKADKMGYSINIKESYPNKLVLQVKKN